MIAGEQFLAIVSQKMILEGGAVRERFVTLGTLVWFDTTVCPHVDNQVTLLCTFVVAFFTVERFFSGVYSSVCCEDAFIRESFYQKLVLDRQKP